MKQFSREGKLSPAVIEAILSEEKPPERKVTLKGDQLKKYFPSSYTPRQMGEAIVKILDGWYSKKRKEQER